MYANIELGAPLSGEQAAPQSLANTFNGLNSISGEVGLEENH